MRLNGESVAQATERSKQVSPSYLEKLKLKEEIKSLKLKKKECKAIIVSLKQTQAALKLTCRECGEEKEKHAFKILEEKSLFGVCNQCAMGEAKQTRKIEETIAATRKANDLMAETIKDIERMFRRHKIPLETQLIKSILFGCTEILNDIQAISRHLNSKDYLPIADIGMKLEKAIVWPTLLYTFTVSDFNQVKTAKILGISRNTLRDRMQQIEEQCPRLIDEYRCRERWPRRLIKQKPAGYLELDPDLEVIHEEVTGGVRVIDSNISG